MRSKRSCACEEGEEITFPPFWCACTKLMTKGDSTKPGVKYKGVEKDTDVAKDTDAVKDTNDSSQA